MLPNQIITQHFSKGGKDGYKTAEVDAFKEQIYKAYNKIYTENNVLNSRVSELNALIQKYNSDKEAIASTLIYAQSTSDKTLSEARAKAEEIVNEANDRAEKEYADKIKANEERLKALQEDYETTKAELQRYSASYTENINAQAKEIIEEANLKAAKIVAEAKTEAEKIEKENADEIKKAKKELKEIGSVISKLKANAYEVTTKINALTEGIKEEFSALSGNFDFSDIEADYVDINSVEPFVMPDLSEILASASKDISSGRKNTDSISGDVKNQTAEMNEYITKIFESIGSGSGDFSSYKEGLTEAFSRDISSKGDISFGSYSGEDYEGEEQE